MFSKSRVTNVLFFVQMIGALVFCGSRFLRILQTVQGVSLAEFILIDAFLVLVLNLALRAHKAQASPVTRQTLIVYSWWTLLRSIILIEIMTRSDYRWSRIDTYCVIGGCVICLMILGWAKGRHLDSLKDPIIRGYLALTFKAFPQLMLAWKIFEQGGNGLPLLAIAVGHATVFIRLTQLGFSIREAGWDRNRIAMATSEVGNELSWIVVTAVWAFR